MKRNCLKGRLSNFAILCKILESNRLTLRTTKTVTLFEFDVNLFTPWPTNERQKKIYQIADWSTVSDNVYPYSASLEVLLGPYTIHVHYFYINCADLSPQMLDVEWRGVIFFIEFLC